MANKPLLITNSKIKKEFSYQKDDVSLNFTLSLENSHELKNFLVCLLAATKDVEETLKELTK